MKAISLFSGAGGMDVGFRAAGFEIAWANDIDQNACKTYELNHGQKIRCGSLDDLFPEIANLAEHGQISCLFGGPPCQGFSVAGKMDEDDPRSKLVWSFMHALEISRPAAFVMENVKALASLDKFKFIREGLAKRAIQLGYEIELVVLNSKDFGVPQSRERMFLVGFHGRKNVFISALKKYKKTAPMLRDVLLNVGKIGTEGNNRICKAKVTFAAKPIMRKSPYAGMMFNGQGRPLNLNGYASTLPASMGGNRTPIVDDDDLYNGSASWVEGYHARLMDGGEPLPFEDAPTRLRRLSVDEAIAIQTFPSEYIFHGPQSSIFKQIGNAVPCKLAEAVACAVRDVLAGAIETEDVESEKNMRFEFM